MNIMITGSAGYIGNVLCRKLLQKGYVVYGVDNLMYDQGSSFIELLDNPNFRFFKEDVRSIHHIKKIVVYADVVIPLAGLVGAPACDVHKEYARQVNHEAVQAMVKVLSKDQRLIIPNTNSGYASGRDESCTEESPLNPVSTYGVTKVAGEKAALEHPDTVVFRLATVFGLSSRPRFDLMVNDFTSQLHELRSQVSEKSMLLPKFKIYEPHFRRNFVHINDVCEAFLFAIKDRNKKMSGVYNLGLPTANLTKLELAKKICEQLELYDGVLEEGKGADPDQRDYEVSNEKILKAGFVFQNSLAKGINEIIKVCDILPKAERDLMDNVPRLQLK